MRAVSSTLRRLLPTAGAIGAFTVFAAAAGATHGVELVVRSLARPPARLAPGATFSVSFREANIGQRHASTSTTLFSLSPTRHLGHGAIRLLGGGVRVRALRPDRAVRRTAWLTLPASTPAGSYYLIACAKSTGRARCRVANGHLVVTRRAGGPGGSGGSGGPVSTGGGGPLCLPSDPPALNSTSSTCFDGDAADGIFVSPSGNDANPGTIAAPKRTLAAGIAAATLVDRDVYVAAAVYPELLKVANGVSVYGGYDSSWQRSPANQTEITGAGLGTTSQAAQATNIGSLPQPTTLQLLTLAPRAPTAPGGSSYGLEGTGDTGLVLDHVTVLAAPGVAGFAGLAGTRGANGGNGDAQGGNFGWGGTSAGGNVGGNGGVGGYGGSGADGQPGQPCSSPPGCMVAGDLGGPGGSAGVGGGNHTVGTSGYDGGSGQVGASAAGGGPDDAAAGTGYWLTQPGQHGQAGSDGGGGGGGGGGGADSGDLCGIEPSGGDGGGGGGGGQGGGGGGGGQGGGGSFGIFLKSSAGAVVRDSSITASAGGAGGNGGSYGSPGAGGLGQAGFPGLPGTGTFCSQGFSNGGNGGIGGAGGYGGAGGGGAGGPSIAISGLTAAAAPGTTVHHGQGGTGGRGGNGLTFDGGPGATGLAADYM